MRWSSFAAAPWHWTRLASMLAPAMSSPVMDQRDPRATILVSCPDRRGLVAALAQLLYGHGINILDAEQHTDTVANQFFQRIRVDLREMHTDRMTLERAIAEVA